MAEPTVLSFTTRGRERVVQPIPVVLCGEEITVQRPKDAVLYSAQVAAADTVGDADRAFAIVQLVNALFDEATRKRFFERLLDPGDPVHLQETLEMVTGLLDRWGDWPEKGKVTAVVVEAAEHEPRGEPIVVQHKELGLRFTAHPPKDIISLFAAASLAAGASPAQEAWAVGLFLDAALDPPDALMVSHRMRSPHDDLDIEHIAEIVQELAQQWAPASGNRAARRAATRTTTARTTTRTTARTAKRPARSRAGK